MRLTNKPIDGADVANAKQGEICRIDEFAYTVEVIVLEINVSVKRLGNYYTTETDVSHPNDIKTHYSCFIKMYPNIIPHFDIKIGHSNQNECHTFIICLHTHHYITYPCHHS